MFYQSMVNEGAAPSRGVSVPAMVAFMGGIFGFSNGEALISSRIRGLGVALRERKAAHKQRPPFPVDMVKLLEKACVNDASPHVRYVAGTAVFALMTRTRVGDLIECNQEPVLDRAPAGDGGYVEVRLMKHKTARPGMR